MNENVNICITPKGDKPVLHFSQFDNERVFTVTVLADDGESAAVLTGLDIEFRLRKTDSHVVTIAPESVADNVITFKTTEQLCACCGQNIATVTLMKDDMVVSTLDILVDIQRDILSGGLTSESDIRNLTTQIEQIVGDDYYTKTEVDGLLADKADSDAVMTKVSRHGIIGDTAYYRFDNNCVAPMDNIECAITAVQSGSGTPSPDNVRPITGHSSCTITVADSTDTPVNTCTVSFGQTVYGGVADVTKGKVNIDFANDRLDAKTWSYNSSRGAFNATFSDKDQTRFTEMICSCYENGGFVYSASEIASKPDKAFYTQNNSNTIFIKDSDYTDPTTWLNALGSNTICYPLVTPIEITFTPATTDSFSGSNKVSSSTGNMKSLTYFSDVNSDLVYLIRACMI